MPGASSRSICLFLSISSFLGIEAYGIVGFYSTLLAVLAFADMGFTATLNREMARLSVRKDSAAEMGDLLRTYESTYLCISSVLAVVVWALAPAIATHWLRSRVLQPHEMATAIRLMGVAISLQLPSALYIGGLMGLEKQVRSNTITIATSICRGSRRGSGVVAFLPHHFRLRLWQLISNAVYCSAARFSLWSALPVRARPIPATFPLAGVPQHLALCLGHGRHGGCFRAFGPGRQTDG